MTRVADLAQYNNTLYYLTQTQSRITEDQTQVASGAKSQNYTGLAPDTNRLVTMQTTHDRITQYQANTKLVGVRLQNMESSVSQVFDIASNFKTLMVNALNGDDASEMALGGQAQSMLDQVASLLDIKSDGRYLFSGSRTDTAPVDLTQLPVSYTIPTASGASIGYYQGDSFKFAVQADDSLSLSYGVTADEPAFEKLIRALDIVVKSPPSDRAALQDALAAVSEAASEIPDVRTKIGAAQAALDQINKRQSDYQLYAEHTIGDIQNVDVAQTMTKLNTDSVNLQASYMAINTLSQLNLFNFLK